MSKMIRVIAEETRDFEVELDKFFEVFPEAATMTGFQLRDFIYNKWVSDMGADWWTVIEHPVAPEIEIFEMKSANARGR